MDKICTKCGKLLSIDCFSKNKNKKLGYNSWCKNCVNLAYEEKKPKKEPIPVGYKYCGRCKKLKPVSEFNKSTAYGYQSFCKECKKEKYKLQPNFEPQQTGTKICSCCGQEKEINAFSISKKSENGRSSKCKECISKYDASRTFFVQMEGTKFCPRCKQELPITDFCIARGNPTGRFYCCKNCVIKFSHEIVNKQCEICGNSFKGRREKDKYCPECKKKQNTHSEPEWEFIHILEKHNIEYKCEFNLEDKFWFDFYLPEYNVLVDINPTYSHSAIKTTYDAKRKYYHWDRRKLAKQNGYSCICIWDWDDKEAIVRAIKENTLKILNGTVINKHWSKAKTKEHIQDNGQDEKQMTAEGYLPVYDDGQTLIY